MARKFKYGKGFTYYTILLTADSRDAQANPTLAAGDVQISKDGGAFANLGTLPTVSPASGVQVKVVISDTEAQCNVMMIRFADAAGAEWEEQTIIFEREMLTEGKVRINAPSGFVESTGVTSAQITRTNYPDYGVLYTDNGADASDDDFDPTLLVGAILRDDETEYEYTILGGYFINDGTGVTTKVFGKALDSAFDVREGGTNTVSTNWSPAAESGRSYDGWTFIVADTPMPYPNSGDEMSIYINPDQLELDKISDRITQKLKKLEIDTAYGSENAIEITSTGADAIKVDPGSYTAIGLLSNSGSDTVPVIKMSGSAGGILIDMDDDYTPVQIEASGTANAIEIDSATRAVFVQTSGSAPAIDLVNSSSGDLVNLTGGTGNGIVIDTTGGGSGIQVVSSNNALLLQSNADDAVDISGNTIGVKIVSSTSDAVELTGSRYALIGTGQTAGIAISGGSTTGVGIVVDGGVTSGEGILVRSSGTSDAIKADGQGTGKDINAPDSDIGVDTTSIENSLVTLTADVDSLVDGSAVSIVTLTANQTSIEGKVDDIIDGTAVSIATLTANQTSIEGKIDTIDSNVDSVVDGSAASITTLTSNQTSIEGKVDDIVDGSAVSIATLTTNQTSIEGKVDDIIDGTAVSIATITNNIGTPSNLGSGATLADNLVDVDSGIDDLAASISTITSDLSDLPTISEIQDMMYTRNVSSRHANEKPQVFTAGSGSLLTTITTTIDANGNVETQTF